ncbi:uncharacterized protein ColSpa_10971 [Colletotrichum spaethianum]|uniref:Celp0028 effector like protein n=1 Tax=Colletotrichum spaethianum TaxID=700344 RepID=A0AA37UPJ1_9PEZI|nr:uncharacterized protein ColSpa_10971 [Colletotrichum spaethianum]GKT50790.1 hypothetical protein ColSpa_10971 [Colletotrichum spaethianum]
MIFTLPFVLFALATAAPINGTSHTSAESLLSSISSLDLDHDDVILYGVNGQYKVIKDAEFQTLTSAGVLTYGGNDKVETRHLLDSSALVKARDCDGSNAEFEITSTADFLDWDVQISPVIGAQQAPVTIAVARGYSLANSVTVGGTAGISAEGISIGLKIDYQQTWTTTDTTTITYTVPTGQYGVIISQPWTHRIYGNVYTSCSTDPGAKSTFMGSSHTSQTYGSMDWVTGVFRLCASKNYPIPYCNGQGSHH